MREEIFHSTLDWQDSREFDEGARAAVAMLVAIGEIPPVVPVETTK